MKWSSRTFLSKALITLAAAGAVGSSPIITPELLAALQAQQRLDARAAGAGKD